MLVIALAPSLLCKVDITRIFYPGLLVDRMVVVARFVSVYVSVFAAVPVPGTALGAAASIPPVFTPVELP